MIRDAQPITILYAEDDEEDQMLTKAAFKKSRLRNDLRIVEDGEELLDYLLHRGEYADADSAPRPDVILLDLNMPRVDGLEALEEIKQREDLRRIPVIVLTTSAAEEDVYRTYDIGASSFITKPVTFENLTEVVKAMGRYWFQIVELPCNGPSG